MTYTSDPVTPALDEFERYYTEKIWDWIPPIYRDEDGLTSNPDVLRALVSILAHQAAIARRSIDHLWEDQFIELCDDWAIPYLGDLVGTRLVHELNRRGRRVDVARTIFYRRRKGTPVVLERLTQDITDWEGTVVESFRRLGRTRHGRDPELADVLTDRSITSIVTPPGGWANLKSTTQGQQVNGPFDGFAHTPDFRQLRGHLGRYNIPKLNFHLYRLIAFPVKFATAVDFGAGRFTFDPSGRDIPLFRPDQRAGVEEWRSPKEGEFPAPIPCRLLGDARYQISMDLLDGLTFPVDTPITAEALSSLVGVPFRNEARLRQTIQALVPNFEELSESELAAFEALFDELLAVAITPSSPKAYLVPSPFQIDPTAVSIAEGLALDPTNTSLDVEPIPHQRIVPGNLADWGASLVDEDAGLSLLSSEKRLVIDPERGRFWFPSPPGDNVPVWVPIYHYGLAGNIGAGTYDRRASLEANISAISTGDINDPGPIAWTVPSLAPPLEVNGFQFEDSKTYQPSGDLTLGIDRVTFQAANLQRPYVQRSGPDVTEWVFTSPDDPSLEDSNGIPHPRSLILDGLWIGIQPNNVTPSPAPCPPVPAALVLKGTFDCVVIRHCTLDPGGEKAQIVSGECQAIPYVQLVVRGGTIEELIIESSIVGPIVEDVTSDPPGAIQRLTLRDSIVHSIAPEASPAIQTRLGVVNLERVTVFGNVFVKELTASEALIQGLVRVTDNQHGCFRFSTTNNEPETRLPPQFESHLFAPGIPNLYFVSRRFGDPGYGQLSDRAPASIVRGAENRSEIGVFSHLLNPIKQDDLNAKASEFMPFGLIAQFINET